MEVIKAFMNTKENGENIYKMLNACFRNSRSILPFMKKEMKDTKRERPEGKCLGSSWVIFYSIFMNNEGPSHTLKARTFFFITFAKNFIIRITWNSILYIDTRLLQWIMVNSLFFSFFKYFPYPRTFPFSFDLFLMIV